MPITDAITTVLSRNAFYRDGYRLLLRISIIQGVVIVLLISTLLTMILSVDMRYVYFATTSDGRIINIVPLNDPYVSPAEVISWASGKAQDVMRFGYNDFRQRLQASSENFTQSGWESFTKAMKEARILEAVETRKLTVSMEPTGAPEIRKAGPVDGVYTWVLHIPVNIKFDGGNEALSPTSATLVLQIVRVSTLQNPKGISIEQWITIQR